MSPNGDWANNVTLDVIGQGHHLLSADDTPQRLVLLAGPGEGRQSAPNNGGWSPERQFTRDWSDCPTLLDAGLDSRAIRRPDRRADVHAGRRSITPRYYEIEFSEDINFSPGDPTTVSCFTNHTT